MPDPNKVYKFGEFVLNPAKRSLMREASEIRLRDKDLDTLLFLIKNAHETCSHDEIIAAVWNGASVENNSIEKAIANIRKALGDSSSAPRYIKTVRARGYLFIGDISPAHGLLPDVRQPANIDPPRDAAADLRRAGSVPPITAAIIAVFAMVTLAIGGWKGYEVYARHGTTVLFADDFSSDSIDDGRWTVKGRTVSVENGVARLFVEQTDQWGRLESRYFPFDRNKPITITSRVKVAYSMNLKDKVYFHGHFALVPKTTMIDQGDINNKLLFGVKYSNYDYESRLPNGDVDEQKSEGFFLVRDGGDPSRRADYESAKVGPRIKPVWDEWFDQKIVYEPFSGKLSYYINGEWRQNFNVGPFRSDLPDDMLRVQINPEGWWLYHSIEIDYIEITQ